MVRPNRGNGIDSSPRHRNAAAVGDKNGTDNRQRREHANSEKFVAVTAAATPRQTDNDGEPGKPRPNGVGRDFDEDYRRRGRHRFADAADDGEHLVVVDGLSAVTTVAAAADEPDNGRRHVDGRTPPEKAEPRGGRRRPSTALATDPTTAVPEPSDVTVSRQWRRKIQSSTLPSPPRPLVTDIRTTDDGGGDQNDYGRKRNVSATVLGTISAPDNRLNCFYIIPLF